MADNTMKLRTAQIEHDEHEDVPDVVGKDRVARAFAVASMQIYTCRQKLQATVGLSTTERENLSAELAKHQANLRSLTTLADRMGISQQCSRAAEQSLAQQMRANNRAPNPQAVRERIEAAMTGARQEAYRNPEVLSRATELQHKFAAEKQARSQASAPAGGQATEQGQFAAPEHARNLHRQTLRRDAGSTFLAGTNDDTARRWNAAPTHVYTGPLTPGSVVTQAFEGGVLAGVVHAFTSLMQHWLQGGSLLQTHGAPLTYGAAPGHAQQQPRQRSVPPRPSARANVR